MTNILQKTNEQLLNLKIENLEKEKITMLVLWLEEILDTKIANHIIEQSEKKFDKLNEFEKEIFMIKYKNLASKLNENKFTKKIIYQKYSVYYYLNKITIYIKNGIKEDDLYQTIIETKTNKITLNKKEIIKKKIKKSSQEFELTNNKEKDLTTIKEIIENNQLDDINITININ